MVLSCVCAEFKKVYTTVPVLDDKLKVLPSQRVVLRCVFVRMQFLELQLLAIVAILRHLLH